MAYIIHIHVICNNDSSAPSPIYRWYAKAIWSFIFLAAIGAWLWHSIVLIQSYIRYDTSSQVKITFDSLDFPTITLCNINPIRENAITRFGSEDLEELLELMRPEETFDSRRRRKRRKVNFDFCMRLRMLFYCCVFLYILIINSRIERETETQKDKIQINLIFL